MTEGNRDSFRIHNELFDEKGFRKRSTPEEREERAVVKSLLDRILIQYREIGSRSPDWEEIFNEMLPYQEELNNLVLLSAESRKRIIRDYPEIIKRLERENGR